ncbi:NAD-binding protein [Pleurocapsales cyanobacterium LEGE 10410]|nr:NAD-binding protein [Pleurocapsales cyanobacterium LEGE 10410]
MLDDKRTQDNSSNLEYFIICGLGSLGQHCVVSLTEFEVKIIAIEQQLAIDWEIESLRDLLDDLIIGDCRHNDVLHRAKIQRCRAALIVTTDDRVNVETAIAIRQLNPETRLVVRSATTNLNQLLSRQLGNYIAFEPTELSTSAFTLAALGTEILGFFALDGQIWQVYQRHISIDDRWRGCSLLDLENNYRKILAHSYNQSTSELNLGDWNASDPIRVGDTAIYLEIANDFDACLSSPRSFPPKTSGVKNWFRVITSPGRQIISFFTQLNFRQQIRRVALVNASVVISLLIVGTILFRWYDPEISTLSAFLATAILLLGGYGDLFSELEDIGFIPWWIRLFSLVLTIVGTVFVGVIYALLTEALLSSRFEFVRQRPPIPQQDHIVIVGMGITGQKIKALLAKFKQKIVGITFNPSFERQSASDMPLITGNLETAFTTANLSQAKSMVIVTDDEIVNLETALMAKAIAPQLNLVLKTSGIRISQHLKTLLPTAQIVGVYAVAAAAFAGAAFGENILNLFRLGDNTILVTEYQIEADDTLHGLLLADISYGYGVVPIIYQQPHRASVLFPFDEPPLKVGDRLVILATIEGLRRIEQGLLDLEAKQWQLRIERALTSDAIFDGANAIARITGCSLALARETMNNLPATLPVLLYRQQAQKLVKELKKTLVTSHLIHS